MGLGTVLERFVIVQPDETGIFADKLAPQLTRSQIVEYCKVDKNAVPDYELRFGAEAYGFWGHSGGYPAYGKGRVVGVVRNALVIMEGQYSSTQVL